MKRKPHPNGDRQAMFRQIGHEVWGRYRDNPVKQAVDLPGIIASMLERVYAQGFMDAQQSDKVQLTSSISANESEGPFMWEWLGSIQRNAFWTCCSHMVGFAREFKGPHIFLEKVDYGWYGEAWRIVRSPSETDAHRRYVHGSKFSEQTLRPLIRNRLLVATSGQDPDFANRLTIGARGMATWQRYLDIATKQEPGPNDYPPLRLG